MLFGSPRSRSSGGDNGTFNSLSPNWVSRIELSHDRVRTLTDNIDLLSLTERHYVYSMAV